MQENVVHELIHQWSAIKSKNPSYSLRAFSKKLDIPHSALSEIISGKRKLTQKMGERVVMGLNLDPDKKGQLLKSIAEKSSYSTLELQSFQALAHWEYLAVLGLFKLKDFHSKTEWMARRLGISSKKIESVLNTLVAMGLVKEDIKGNLKRSSSINLNTPSQIKDKGLRQFTIESLEKAIESLRQDKVEDRDFSTVSLTVNKKDLPKAKKMLEEFRYKFDQEIESVPGEELYKLVLGFYSISKSIKEKNS
jgi:uncharacterized protein (TIGR02147 family)